MVVFRMGRRRAARPFSLPNAGIILISGMIKFASPRDNFTLTASILDKIYDENPEYWPHGLTTMHFDDLYLVEKSASMEKVGFVGWQQRQEGNDLVGYYSVGILPEYRRQGLAKKAVNQMLDKHAYKVDRVKAIIEDGNEASIALADTLPLDEVEIMNKSAMKKKAFKGLGSLFNRQTLGGASKHLGLGALSAAPNTVGTELYSQNPGLEEGTIAEYLLNSLLGGVASKGFSAKSGMGSTPHVTGMGSLATLGFPAKNLIFQGKNSLRDLPQTLQNIPANNVETSPSGSDSNIINNLTKNENLPLAATLGVLGVGGLGLGAYGLKRWLDHKQDEKEDRERPRLRVTLPTKDEGDVETSLELPGSSINLSKKIYTQVARDTKRRLRAGGSERTRRRTVDV